MTEALRGELEGEATLEDSSLVLNLAAKALTVPLGVP
jgi:hypothetical protein